MNITLATTDDQIRDCFPVMAELRPDLERDRFVDLIREMQQDGYLLARLDVDGAPVAVAGYRFKRTLFCRHFLYVDDLVTLASERSKGFGAVLLEWLASRAREAGCRELHLDSGMHRTEAHRFYRNQGMETAGYHFRLNTETE